MKFNVKEEMKKVSHLAWLFNRKCYENSQKIKDMVERLDSVPEEECGNLEISVRECLELFFKATNATFFYPVSHLEDLVNRKLKTRSERLLDTTLRFLDPDRLIPSLSRLKDTILYDIAFRANGLEFSDFESFEDLERRYDSGENPSHEDMLLLERLFEKYEDKC